MHRVCTIPARGSRLLTLAYAATVFVSAFLLFQVQPLISGMILPWFGGSPAVWTTCMLFFQCVLFLGYAYAHAAHGKLSPRWQAAAHLALLLTALALAHIEPSSRWKPYDASAPTWRILLLLAACVGLPYFVLSTTGPLLQAWFSRSHPGRSPYRLYALSNAGSLLALLSYPFWFEPRFGLSQQANLWFWGFAAFVALCGLTAAHLWRAGSVPASSDVPTLPSAGAADAPGELPADAPPLAIDRAFWVLLPALGSFMLLATTNHVCQDVAVVPFLWVIPLSAYLLTFIIAFDHPRWYRPLPVALLTIVSLYAVGAIYFNGFKTLNITLLGHLGLVASRILAPLGWLLGRPEWSAGDGPRFAVSFVLALSIYFVSLFLVCLTCHGQLARLRPAPRYLTGYFLCIAAGGALGGMLVSLVAPLLFKTYMEWKLGVFVSYVLAMVVALGCWMRSRTAPSSAASPRPEQDYQPSGATAAPMSHAHSATIRRAKSALCGVVAIFIVVGLSDVAAFLSRGGMQTVEAARNFYGTVNISEIAPNDPQLHGYAMFNGNVIHGFQFSDPKKRGNKTAYYSPNSGVGRTLEHLQQRKALKVGAVGLGIGTLAAYCEPRSRFRFYEINPVAEQFARDTRYFTYLADHAEQTEVVLGDARLSLEREAPQHYDLLVLDAFSGDAIPRHLLTREAFEIYRGHLAAGKVNQPSGSIAIHITNKFLDLRPVVLAGAEQLGMQCLEIESSEDHSQMFFPANWMILTNDAALIEAIKPHARPSQSQPRLHRWTDDHSDPYSLRIR